MFLIPEGLADRTSEIQAALNAGGEIRFKPGLYRMRQVEIRSNTRLVIEQGAVLQKMPEVSEQILLHVSQEQNIVIEGGGTVDGNKTQGPRTRSHCIGIEGGSRIVIRDLRIINAPTSPLGGSYGDGLYLGAGAFGWTPIDRLECENLVFDNCDRHCVQMVSCVDAVFRKCRFANVTTGDPGSCFNIETELAETPIQNILWDSCVFERGQQGLTANNHQQSPWSGLAFKNCLFRNNRNQGVYCGGRNTDWNAEFVGCLFEENGQQIESPQQYGHGFYGYQTKGTQFRGCTFRRNILGNGLQLQDSTDFLISDCDMHENDWRGIYLSQVEAPFDGVVSDCRAFDNCRSELSAISGVEVWGSGSGEATCRIHFARNSSGSKSWVVRQTEGIFLNGSWPQTATTE